MRLAWAQLIELRDLEGSEWNETSTKGMEYYGLKMEVNHMRGLESKSLYRSHDSEGAVPQDDDIPGIVRFQTYEVLKKEVNNPKLRWAYLPYSMHMAGPREAIQHMIIRKNYGAPRQRLLAFFPQPTPQSEGMPVLSRAIGLTSCTWPFHVKPSSA